MGITVTGRQLEITAAIRERVELRLQFALADTTVKVTSANVVIERVRNSFTISAVVNCKYHVVKALATDFDLNKAIDAVGAKIDSQIKVLHDKIHDHQAVPLCDAEAVKAAEASVDAE